jgi:hypothetical protein
MTGLHSAHMCNLNRTTLNESVGVEDDKRVNCTYLSHDTLRECYQPPKKTGPIPPSNLK